MKTINIQEPIWKDRSVGINEEYLLGPNKEIGVDILYQNRFGERVYPNTLYVSTEFALKCPVQVRKRVRLRIVPISSMQETINLN